jgi:hypothetical protein
MILATLAFCQGATANPPLGNDAIVEMVHAGLADEIIIAKIQASQANYDLSTAGLIALSKENVPNEVIKTMIEAQAMGQGANAPAPVAATPDPNSPDSPHDAGIYLYAKTVGGPQMIQLEPTAYTEGKTSGVLASALTNGIAKVKWLAVIRGTKAEVRCTDPSPVFYFYFEENNDGQGHSPFANSSPNEFTIQRFDVKENSRETVVMSANAFGASSGSDDKKTVAFDFVKLRPGVYKVTPKVPLAPGEYAFIASHAVNPYPRPYRPGAAVTSHVFDFGVN